ncbi:hypothetical protein LY28_03293 [Ruminiclostridium sufflavum DSM 19573]|uniref:Uncharacterized protein n=1 Tax=Ruminiclostridium sufflavum DSM 19573 TaxID=1121337 RepID=A0A318XGF9_9FIRM|nr:hypothetical protein [Ruminiclostridium sufflavum]PYG85605.1 hypothetical protein LY28_03293 [Ruminiclostridium sufflavum DSM 19573]
MAFVNERMTKEEMAEFEAKAIKNPGNRLSIFRPYQWTINREENIYLIWALREREEPHDYYFLLGWKGTLMPVKLREYWAKGSPRIWSLLHVKIPEELKVYEHEISKSLKNALTVYAFNGNPSEPFNKTTNVEFNF